MVNPSCRVVPSWAWRPNSNTFTPHSGLPYFLLTNPSSSLPTNFLDGYIPWAACHPKQFPPLPHPVTHSSFHKPEIAYSFEKLILLSFFPFPFTSAKRCLSPKQLACLLPSVILHRAYISHLPIRLPFWGAYSSSPSPLDFFRGLYSQSSLSSLASLFLSYLYILQPVSLLCPSTTF